MIDALGKNDILTKLAIFSGQFQSNWDIITTLHVRDGRGHRK